MTLLVAGGSRATAGARAYQEDASILWPAGARAALAQEEGLLAVVADGMGGHAGGKIAGQAACEAFAERFAKLNGPGGARLNPALQAGNTAIADQVAIDPALKGMGCTLVAAWLDRQGLKWVSVGDSLLLLYRYPNVVRLNADHSLGYLLDEQARRNQISRAEARQNRNRHALRSALTGKPIDLIDLREEPYEVKADDWLFLASDGLASLSGDEIGDIAFRNRFAAPDEMAARLIQAVEAKKVEDQDNATVIALRIAVSEDIAIEVVKSEFLRPAGGAQADGSAPMAVADDAPMSAGSRILALTGGGWHGLQSSMARHGKLWLVAATVVAFALGALLRLTTDGGGSGASSVERPIIAPAPKPAVPPPKRP
ncbi:MAG: PP2C family protein-serine/threonine phosphatase [Hyphomicrobium sp.]